MFGVKNKLIRILANKKMYIFSLILFYPIFSNPKEDKDYLNCISNFTKECFLKIEKKEMEIDSIDPIGRTALIYATLKGDLELVKLLSERNADIDVKDEDGLSALSFASSLGYIDIVEFLLSKNADPNSLSYCWWRPSMWAALSGNTKILNLLKKKGSLIKKKAEDGKNTLDILSLNPKKRKEYINSSKCFSVTRRDILPPYLK